MPSNAPHRTRANLAPHLAGMLPDDSGPGREDVASRLGLEPGEVIMLNRNENPYGPSPKALEAMRSAEVHRYPTMTDFLEAVSTYADRPQEEMMVGAGLDGLLDTLTRLFLEPGDRAFIPLPTYTYYEFLVRLYGGRPLRGEASKDSSYALPDAIPTGVKLAFLCSPNNPTGDVLEEEKVRSLVEGTDAVVFLDEAYAEFADQNLIRLVSKYENLVVGRTLSKAFALAGLRLGYAAAPPWITQEYRNVAPSFGISSPSLAAGVAALDDLEHIRRNVDLIIREREHMRKALSIQEPSGGNFLYLKTDADSSWVTEDLLSRGIAVKDMAGVPGVGRDHIRVTVGLPAENQAFLGAYLDQKEVKKRSSG